MSFLFARDGVEALAALKANGGIDLVVTDINMPRMDGLTLLQTLQETEEKLSTIIVSAYGDMINIRTAMNRGAFDFVTKPIDFTDLETTIAKTLRHIEILRQARQRQATAERAYASLSRYFSPNLAQRLANDTDAINLTPFTKPFLTVSVVILSLAAEINNRGLPMWTKEARIRHAPREKRYPSDVTDAEWAIIAPIIPPPRQGGRHRETDMRDAMNAVRYVLRTGCQRRQLPKDFPPRSTVYNYFWEWTRYGVLDRIHHMLLVQVREVEGREASPTAAIIDTQAVKATEKGASEGSSRIRRSKENQRHQTQCHRRYDRPPSRHRGDPGQHPGPRLRCQSDPQDAPSVPMDR